MTKRDPNRMTRTTVLVKTGVLVWVLLLAFRGAAQTPPPEDAGVTKLVRQAVALELAATNKGSKYMCRVDVATPQRTETRLVVDTRDMGIDRLILNNDKPLTSSQNRQEEKRLHALLTNRKALLKYQAQQQADLVRLQKVIQALPDAFLYQQSGMEKDDNGRELVLVTGHPNPDFHPRTRELRMLARVQGTMLIDKGAKRIVRIEAQLLANIDFGWGIIFHVSRGGRFSLDQRAVWPDQWAVTTWSLHGTSRTLLMFSDCVDVVTKASDFRRLPSDLTQHQALELLLASDPMTSNLSTTRTQ